MEDTYTHSFSSRLTERDLHQRKGNLFIYINHQLQSMIHPIYKVQAQSEPAVDNFIFQGFRGIPPSKITLSNSSKITNGGAIQLTNSTSRYQTGHAFYSQPLQMFRTDENTVVESFSTSFVFQILPLDIVNGGGHGLAFVIAPASQLPDGAPGSKLGIFNPNKEGNFSNHILAIEFDTVRTGNGDIDSNHVGIDVNSIKSVTSVSASFYNTTSQNQPLKIESGKANQVWIDYNGTMKLITVSISPLSVPKPRKPLISFNTDISKVMKKSMYVGFSSATGKLSSAHFILGWSFRLGGESEPLDLKRLGVPPRMRSSDIKKKSIGVGVGSSVFVIIVVISLACSYIYYLQVQKYKDVLEDWEVDFSHRFPYKELYIATKGFNKSEIIGSGGFGCVYKGLLPSTKQEVAIKKVTHNSRQGIREFIAEVESLGRMRHKHLVHLHGWCKRKDDLLLVYEYMPNGSLDDILFNDSKMSVLEWATRFKVLKGIASAMLYLHEEWEHLVVHRDIKASNVLLDSKMDGRLGDFGLARLYQHGNNQSTTHIVGTLGYMAPELARTNKATPSCDVYSFGALLLEVASGRRPVDSTASSSQILLVEWARDCWLEGNVLKAADPKLENCYVVREMELVLKLGLICCQRAPTVRPTMRQVCSYLDGNGSLELVSPNVLDIKASSSGTGSSSTSSFSIGFISSDSMKVKPS